MPEPAGFEKRLRAAMFIVLGVVVVIAPLLGVYALSPLFFVWGVQPYQLAVAVAVMFAEAFALAALVWLVLRPPR